MTGGCWPQDGRGGDSGSEPTIAAPPPENGAQEAAPIVTVFGQLRSGEIHEFGTVDADAGDTAQDVMEALAALLRECADCVPTLTVDPELGPDAARWSPPVEQRQDAEP